MEIRNLLVLSTAHVTQATAEMLDNTNLSDWPVAGGHFGDYGWFLYAHDEDSEKNIPADLMAIFNFARSNGCWNVLLDRDADPVDGLPKYEW